MEEKDLFEGGEGACAEQRLADSGETTENAGPGAARGGGVSPEDLQEMMGQIPPELLAPDLPVLLASIVSMLEDQAWRFLGLVANPITQQVERDLPKAKIAIDIVAYIVSQVSPLVSGSQRGDLQNKVATLQMNFVEQSRRG